MIAPLGFHHVAIQVRDVERVAGFYVGVLGLRELRRHLYEDGRLRSIWVAASSEPGERAFLAVEHLEGEGPRGALGYSMVALRIAAAQRPAVEAALAEKGVAIERRTGWTLYVRDPEGNLVGLSHHPDAAP
jgi:catechol 2,3-dioxygenase-like lactoylglutathione lyase family enzyme